MLNPGSDMGRGLGLDGAWPENGKLSDGLSYALLADALDNDARALRLHHAFRRRVSNILPDRWTLSRSRIRAYADLIEQYQEVEVEADVRTIAHYEGLWLDKPKIGRSGAAVI